MRIAAVVAEIRNRCQNRGITDRATGQPDSDEIEFYLLQSLRWYTVRHQLDMFLHMHPALLTTVSEQNAYPIPERLWGWWAPENETTSGLCISASGDTGQGLLHYLDPATFQRTMTTTTGRPGSFTLAENLLWLTPIPDDVYTVSGVTKTALESEDDVPDQYVPAMQARALYMLASDKGKLSDDLVAEERELQTSLVNNNARMHQQFRRQNGWRSRRQRRV